MEYENTVIGCETQVALDTGAELQRCGESDKAVLGKAGAIVQTPVREPFWARVERVRL